DFVDASTVKDGSVFDVELAAGAAPATSITRVDDAAIADYKNVFGPHTPAITGLSIMNDHVVVGLDPAGETDVTLSIYRDGALLVSNLASGRTSYEDTTSGDHATRTHCYAVESTFTGSGNASQHSMASCDWGVATDRIQSYDAQGFVAQGGMLTQDHGKWH